MRESLALIQQGWGVMTVLIHIQGISVDALSKLLIYSPTSFKLLIRWGLEAGGFILCEGHSWREN